MKKVTGIGGVFFKAKDPDMLREWYSQHLGIDSEKWGFSFNWSDDPQKDGGVTSWSIFPDSSKYFDPSTQPFMINFRVANLQELLTELRAAGLDVDPKSGEDSDFGKFGWVMDPEGNRVELWEPPAAEK